MASEEKGVGLGQRLELRRLRKLYGSMLAVDDVRLTIEPGEFMTLLGPSGSGKTSTLKMIAGFEYPDSGDILLGDSVITHSAPHTRNIGMVFQNYALFPHMTVFDNIAFPLRMRRIPAADIKKTVAQVLESVQLAPLAKRYPAQLSGGQQQRVALARAIVFRPPLLLMDEPLGALDQQLRRSVQIHLKEITRELGITVVLVTHDQDEALFFSDRVAIMQQGRIAQADAPNALYAQPKNRFIAEFLGATNFLDGQVIACSGTRATLRTVSGAQIQGIVPEPLPVGSQASALLRPETIRINEADGAMDRNVFPALTRDASFIGNAWEYQVKVGNQLLYIHVQNRSEAAILAPGTTITLSADAEDCLIFPKAVA